MSKAKKLGIWDPLDYGVFLLSRLVAAGGKEIWQPIEATSPPVSSRVGCSASRRLGA